MCDYFWLSGPLMNHPLYEMFLFASIHTFCLKFLLFNIDITISALLRPLFAWYSLSHSYTFNGLLLYIWSAFLLGLTLLSSLTISPFQIRVFRLFTFHVIIDMVWSKFLFFHRFSIQCICSFFSFAFLSAFFGLNICKNFTVYPLLD